MSIRLVMAAVLGITIPLGLGISSNHLAPPEIPESIKEADGLQEALKNLRAVMAKGPVVSPEKSIDLMKVQGHGHRRHRIGTGCLSTFKHSI
ncbi:MAG: hypothetical protein ACKO23_03390 [Gemmataceae bacterium]